jgi:hypothetical protein
MKDRLTVQFISSKREAGIASPKHGSFASLVDQDDGLCARAVVDCPETSLGPSALELLAMNLGGRVIAELADVARAQAPALASDDRGGDLSPGADADRTKVNLRAAAGEFGKKYEGVGRVQSYAYQVHPGWFGHVGRL